LVPSIVFTKNPSNPLVWAWVTIKKATPKVIPARDMSIDFLFAKRKRMAILRLEDMGESLLYADPAA
jgi:hypothetical protein